MPAPPSGVQQFPMTCVSCAASAAMPYYAMTLPNGGMEVGMRCRDCAHEWRFEMPVTTPVLMPKADRREHD